MRIKVLPVGTALAASGVLCAASPEALAADAFPNSMNTPPSGAGSEQVTPRGPRGVREGVEASAGIGTGFSDTYGLGFEGRVGYTFQQGVYVGGDAQYFIGHHVNGDGAYAAFVGGQLGYKFFPTETVEVRPYVFAGPAFIRQVAPGITNTKTDFALQPGVLASYHTGPVFLGGDAHFMAIPAPNTLALTVTAGYGF